MLAALLPLAYLAAVTAALWTTDLDERRLPNRLVIPGYAAALGGVVVDLLLTGRVPLATFGCGAAYFVFLLALHSAGGMGMGDVKLAGVLGATAGLVHPAVAMAAVVAAFVGGAVGAVVVLVRDGRGGSIPFGPFMLAGFWVAVLWGWVALSPGASST